MKKQALLMGLTILSTVIVSGLAHADPKADFQAAQDRQDHLQLIQTIQTLLRSHDISPDGFGAPERESDCGYYACSYYLESKSQVCSVDLDSSDGDKSRGVSCVLLAGDTNGDAQQDYAISVKIAEHDITLNALKSAISAKGIGDSDFGDFKEVGGDCVPEIGCTDDTYYIESSAHACRLTTKNGSNIPTQTICDPR